MGGIIDPHLDWLSGLRSDLNSAVCTIFFRPLAEPSNFRRFNLGLEVSATNQEGVAGGAQAKTRAEMRKQIRIEQSTLLLKLWSCDRG
jgi:hypothetical protein